MHRKHVNYFAHDASGRKRAAEQQIYKLQCFGAKAADRKPEREQERNKAIRPDLNQQQGKTLPEPMKAAAQSLTNTSRVRNKM